MGHSVIKYGDLIGLHVTLNGALSNLSYDEHSEPMEDSEI